MDQPQELVFLSQAQRMLAQARSIDDVKDLRNKAEAVKAYARKAKLGQNLIMEASMIKLLAERKLGIFLKSLPLAKSAGRSHAGDGDAGPQGDAVFLRDLGLSKQESFRAQQIAGLSDDVFQQYLDRSAQEAKEPTTAGLLRLVRKLSPKKPKGKRPVTPIVSSLYELVAQGAKFSTFYADPPWPYDNQASCNATSKHYSTLTLEQICAEPVAQLAEDKAHLHLWTTNGFLREAFVVMEAWGFKFKSCFVWVKPQIGVGNYWRVSHEFMLLGVKGNLSFRDSSAISWLCSDRTEHSQKPHAIRRLIEKVSPMPYLELYGRHKPPNFMWAVYGNQVENEMTLFDEIPDEEETTRQP